MLVWVSTGKNFAFSFEKAMLQSKYFFRILKHASGKWNSYVYIYVCSEQREAVILSLIISIYNT